jgi:hypothetical protein
MRFAGPLRWGDCTLQGARLWPRHPDRVVRPLFRRRAGCLFPHPLLVTRSGHVRHWIRARGQTRRFPPLRRGRFHRFHERLSPEFLKLRLVP